MKTCVLPMGFSPRQVHYVFNVTKEIDGKTFLGWKGYTQLYFQVAGQSLESHSLRASLYAASRSLPLGPSVRTAVPHSCTLSLCPWRCHHSSLCSLSCSLVALPPCHAQSTGRSSLYWVNSHVLLTGVQWASQPGPGENPGHRNSHFIHNIVSENSNQMLENQ